MARALNQQLNCAAASLACNQVKFSAADDGWDKKSKGKCRERRGGWAMLKIVIRRKKFSIFDSHGWCGK